MMRIGPYEVLGEVGRGGMGVVFRVRTPEGSDAALKLLLKADPATFARFERERRLQGALGEEAGFVGLLDAGVSDERGVERAQAWIVMPFVPGGTLRDRLRRGPLGVAETIALGEELARALGHAHERGIVHRDVKPENVLFTASGRALLADLGLAKHFDRAAPGASQSLSLSRSGAFRGTAGYMSPEQIETPSSVGPPADVFALGAVLHECLSGRPAFRGETVFELLANVTDGTVEPVDRPDLPAWLAGVLGRALDPDPAARFANGADLARSLGERGARPRRALPLVAGAALGAALLGGLLVAASWPAAPAPAKPVEVAKSHEPPAKTSVPAKAETPATPSTADSEAPPPGPGTEELVALANAKLANKDVEGAIEGLTAAIEREPERPITWAIRAAARGMKGDVDGAIADSTRAIELDPGLAKAWVNRSLARFNKHDLEGSIADATKAIALDPGLPGAWACRADALALGPDLDRAFSDYSKAIELDPGSGELWSHRGSVRGRNGDPAGALADLTKATELDPGLPNAWANRGILRAAKDEVDGAIADFTRAIELEPGFTAAWANRGSARLSKGDSKGAIADLERALALGPDRATTQQIRDLLARARKRAP